MYPASISGLAAPHRPPTPTSQKGTPAVVGVTELGQTRQTLWYVASVRSILNQPSLSSLGHHHSDFLVIEFFFRATRSPVDVPTVLQLSGGYSGSSFSCLGTCAQGRHGVDSGACLLSDTWHKDCLSAFSRRREGYCHVLLS